VRLPAGQLRIWRENTASGNITNTSQLIADRFDISDMEEDLLNRVSKGHLHWAADNQPRGPTADELGLGLGMKSSASVVGDMPAVGYQLIRMALAAQH
jgi:hypothetical protein